MNAPRPSEVLAELTEMLRSFPGREFSGEIGAETWFFGDLGFASIDAVVLGEMLADRFDCQLPMGQLMNEWKQSGRDDVRVGEIVEFLQRHLASTAGPE